MSREAMKQALEALDTLARHENPETKIQVRKKDGGLIVTIYPHKVAFDAAQAIRSALNAPKWVGLTEDEVDDIWNRYCDEMGEASINDAQDIANAIEQALKEKNT